MVMARVAATQAVRQTKGKKNKLKAAAVASRSVKRAKSMPDEHLGWRGSDKHNDFVKKAAALRDNKLFSTSIIGVIFLAAILVGIQTYPITDPATVETMEILDTIVLYIFILELVVKFAAEGKYPFRFFTDNWNVFDFLIVVVGVMPFGGSAVTALRLIRLLRVLKLVRALPKLRILVMGLLKSMSSIAYIGLLLMLLFYLYAVLGVSLFGANDPETMGTLHICLLTLFRCATLEDWTDVMYTAMYGCENYGYGGIEDECKQSSEQPMLSVLYFVSFTILSSMMILNLFIGVITSSMQDAKTELTAEMEAEKAQSDAGAPWIDDLIATLKRNTSILDQLEGELADYAEMDKFRRETSIVLLSSKEMLLNKEMSVSQTDVDQAVEAVGVLERLQSGIASSHLSIHSAGTIHVGGAASESSGLGPKMDEHVRRNGTAPLAFDAVAERSESGGGGGGSDVDASGGTTETPLGALSADKYIVREPVANDEGSSRHLL